MNERSFCAGQNIKGGFGERCQAGFLLPIVSLACAATPLSLESDLDRGVILSKTGGMSRPLVLLLFPCWL